MMMGSPPWSAAWLGRATGKRNRDPAWGQLLNIAFSHSQNSAKHAWLARGRRQYKLGYGKVTHNARGFVSGFLVPP